ncbi:MAG TPA: radical SAM family heme chaperone HemW [Dehalococcoidales bacterium]|nr:radical SAM family heme chaperone HemW [Dehalococcoidales bacterium]
MSRDIALYIHVPFCRRKCPYCSFVSYDYREADIPLYLSALKNELIRRAGGECIRSIYFGGGTPSLLPAEHIGDLLSAISSLFTVDEAAEITIEANPGTVNEAYLTSIRKLGANRLSLGVQSMNDRELALLGRIHTAAEAREAVRFARSSGFDNLSLDLIYGLPGQTLADWQHSLDEAIAMGPEHLSLYALTLEADTPMWRAAKEGSLPEIDPDLSADQYELAEDLLAAQGYGHYEISNWARPGHECRHNLTYWRNLPYLGVGVAAHSCLDGHRMANTGSLDKYMADFSGKLSPLLPELDEEIGPELALAETVILRLRLSEGVYADDIRHRFGIDILTHYGRQVEEMVVAGLMERTDGNIKLTRRGRLLSNEVFWRFLPG